MNICYKPPDNQTLQIEVSEPVHSVTTLMSQHNLSRVRCSSFIPKHISEDYEDFSGFNFDEIEDPTINNNMSQFYNDQLSQFKPLSFKSQTGKKCLTFGSIQSNVLSKNKNNQVESFYDIEANSLEGQTLQNQQNKFTDHLFEEDNLSNGFTVNSDTHNIQSVVSKPKARPKPKLKPKNNDQEELSDYDNQSDEQVSQYHNSLFGQVQNKSDRKSVLSNPHQKFNSSHELDNQSDDIKNSQKTNHIIAKRSDPKRQMNNRFKDQKREKVYENSAQLTQQNPVAINKREKIQNKKRFSKKQLELVSRKFQQYYAYETNRQFKGEKITLRQIGQAFQLGHATIHKLYAEWMDDPYFYERIKRYDQYRKQTKNPERKLTLERLQHITRLIKENPFLTQHQLCVELNKIEDLKVIKCGQPQNMTRTIVGKLLKMGKFRKKRVKCMPKEKNTSKSLQKRLEYCIKYKEILERRAKVYFLDESGFNLYMTRDKAWSRPNEEITVNCPISKGKRFSLIAIIGDDGLAHWRFIEGNYRKFEYLDFIRQLFQKLVQHQTPDDPEERWIVMDNCAIHDKEQTINLAKQHGINVLYMPSYSPQLNPIQNWFHQIKIKLKKINYSGERQLFNIMERILKEYQDHDFSNYYHGSLKFVEKGLKKEKF